MREQGGHVGRMGWGRDWHGEWVAGGRGRWPEVGGTVRGVRDIRRGEVRRG